ncbi:hypothetical protein [Methanocella sp. MCL-LM]|uniref:hypothetical protein n=1 Tax=Methanocella sp. MCL-LM TaxID=3412035 RepID=UPI003C75B178
MMKYCHIDFNIPTADSVRILLDIDPAVTDNAELPAPQELLKRKTREYYSACGR